MNANSPRLNLLEMQLTPFLGQTNPLFTSGGVIQLEKGLVRGIRMMGKVEKGGKGAKEKGVMEKEKEILFPQVEKETGEGGELAK